MSATIDLQHVRTYVRVYTYPTHKEDTKSIPKLLHLARSEGRFELPNTYLYSHTPNQHVHVHAQ